MRWRILTQDVFFNLTLQLYLLPVYHSTIFTSLQAVSAKRLRYVCHIRSHHPDYSDKCFFTFVEPGTFALENPSYLIKESIGKACIKVERTQGTDGKVEVKWKTMDQTAVNGKDYHGGSGTLVFEHGEQVKHIAIDIIDDKEFEKDETFIVELTGTSEGAHLGSIKSAAVTIVNDDGK